jgi:hypothetical protein
VAVIFKNILENSLHGSIGQLECHADTNTADDKITAYSTVGVETLMVVRRLAPTVVIAILATI